MLHFQELDVYQCSIEFVALAHRVRERLELLERIVAMLTKLIERGDHDHDHDHGHGPSPHGRSDRCFPR
jgi:predicted deacetylase